MNTSCEICNDILPQITPLGGTVYMHICTLKIVLSNLQHGPIAQPKYSKPHLKTPKGIAINYLLFPTFPCVLAIMIPMQWFINMME